MGKKIQLRTLKEADALPIYENIRDEQVTQYLRELPQPYLLKDAYDFVESSQVTLQKGTELDLAICSTDQTDDSAFRGIIALANISNSGVKREKTGEVGYWVGRKYWGKGFGSEALSLITDYGFEELGLSKIYACVMPQNAASIHLLEKCGFQFDRVLPRNTRKNGKLLDEQRYVKVPTNP